MPKKVVRNAFYFYMMDFKEEQRKKGIIYANMKEVADAAGPLWPNVSASVRNKYESKANVEKQKMNVPQHKYTSTGISLAVIEQQQKELQKAEAMERKDIQNLVKLKTINNEIIEQDFFLMDVNEYCQVGKQYIIGEITILRFTLQDGIKDYYHERINPGYIPAGYASDMKLACQTLGLMMPDDEDKTNYMDILANIIDYLKTSSKGARQLSAIFTMPDKVQPLQDFIYQLCSRASEDESLFRVYNLSTLFFTLINAIKTNETEGFPKESIALMQLKKDTFRYSPGLECKDHSDNKPVECTLSRVKRWAFCIMDFCCPIMGLNLIPGKHVPHDFDIESVITYKDQKNVRVAPSVAKPDVMPSSSSSVVSEAFEASSSFSSTVEGQQKEKRVHQPLRMPVVNYSDMVRQGIDMKETAFLSVTGAGRGRSLAGSFNKLQINK